jgi:hypothetical protein
LTRQKINYWTKHYTLKNQKFQSAAEFAKQKEARKNSILPQVNLTEFDREQIAFKEVVEANLKLFNVNM